MKNGKTAFITGGSRGIGLGIAEALVQQGYKVAITGRHKASADDAVEKLNAIRPNSALAAIADVRKPTELHSAVQRTVATFGSIDVVVANAGVGHFAPVEELSSDDWQQTIDTNLTGIFHTVKACLDQIIANQGYIITIASLAGANFFAGGTAYNASKFGVVGFTQALMLDLRHKGVKVTTIMPGSVATGFNNHSPDAEKDAWKIQPEDIGQLVTGLLSMPPNTLPSKIEVRPSKPPA